MSYTLNEATCYARKSLKGEGFYLQCPNKKKTGNYCGKHTDCTNPFTMLIENAKIVQTVFIKPPEAVIIKDVGNTANVSNVDNEKKQRPAVFDKNKYQNKTDFYTFEDIESIPLEFFYEYKESNQVFAFDIRTLHDYIMTCNPLDPIKNPYTHVDFPKEKIEEIKKLHKKLSKTSNVVDYKEEIQLTGEKKLEWRVLQVFQKMNELGHYVEYKWFWNLTLSELKRMYTELEDLWNYRLFLTHLQKQKILPGYFPFVQYSVSTFNKINDLNEARKIFIGEIDRFISLGKPEGKNGNDNKYTGSIIVLTALVQISPAAAGGLPHLVPVIE